MSAKSNNNLWLFLLFWDILIYSQIVTDLFSNIVRTTIQTNVLIIMFSVLCVAYKELSREFFFYG